MTPLDEWRRRALTFEYGQYKIAYWREKDSNDQKPVLLLIHGFPTSSWDWSGVWGGLSARFSLVAADMLGFGLSDKPRNIRYHIRDQADILTALISKLNLHEVHILSHDYGVSVAQELLARQLDADIAFEVTTASFLNGGLFPELHRPRPIQQLGISPLGPIVSRLLSRDKLRKGFDEIFGEKTKASDAEIDAHWSLITENDGNLIFHKLLRYMIDRQENRDRWVGALEKTDVPLLLINGGADPVSGEHLFDYFRKTVPGANAKLLPDIGHYPQTEAPDIVLESFLDFHGDAAAQKAREK